jgi:glycosyltransferase involved in cell wall biosynthesis
LQQKLSIGKELVVLSPHFKVFVKDQVVSLSPFLKKVTVLMPTPYFSRFALSLPIAKNRFAFVNQTISWEPCWKDFNIYQPRFFTLPIETIRKKNHIAVCTSCLNLVKAKKMKFNLIHAHFMDFGFIGAALKHYYGAPFVLTAHGSDVYDFPFRKPWYNALAKYVLKSADKVITVSQFNANKLLSLGLQSNKLHIIPNGYNHLLFRPIPQILMRKKLGLPLNKKVLLSIGNLVDAKGHTYLIDAMKILLKRRSDLLLIIIGSGPLENFLAQKICKLRLGQQILLIGQKNHEEIPIWINAADIFVLPSKNEGFPTVIPEALACGKPVIGSKIGGIPEVLNNTNVGMLVNPQDPHGLADAVFEALDKDWDPLLISDYSHKYTWKNISKQILQIYRSF